MSEAESGKAMHLNQPPNGAGGDVSRCPVCEYRAGPFMTAKAAADDYLRHLNSKHGRMMVACECGWTSGPHGEKFSGIAALVQHAAQEHGIVARGSFPEFNDKIARQAVARCMALVKRVEDERAGKRVVAPGDPPFDPAAALMGVGHASLAALASVLDLMLDARTGKPALRSLMPSPEPEKENDASGA